MRFLRIAYNAREEPDIVVLRHEFDGIFERMALKDGSFTPDEYLPGSSGERRLFEDLVQHSGLDGFK